MKIFKNLPSGLSRPGINTGRSRDGRSREGFAMVIVLVVIAILSVAAIPLLGVVDRNEENTVKQRVVSRLAIAARENLEIGVQITKMAGGVPAYYASSFDSAATELGNACERRLDATDPDVLANGGFSIVSDARIPPVEIEEGVTKGIFVINKGTGDDSRYIRYLVIGCARHPRFGISVATSELADLQGSFQTLNFTEY
jgi:Tfp pilus assembly protein PilX